jgi:plasmid stability protein
MAVVTVRNLSDATHRGLRLRAVQNGRSTEAEIRAILDAAIHPPERLQLGSALRAIGQQLGGLELDITRDKTPIRPVDFE